MGAAAAAAEVLTALRGGAALATAQLSPLWFPPSTSSDVPGSSSGGGDVAGQRRLLSEVAEVPGEACVFFLVCALFLADPFLAVDFKILFRVGRSPIGWLRGLETSSD